MVMNCERGEHESAKSYVLRVLIDSIVNTRLEPGEKLNEPELCEQLGVSRTPFREAELELAQRRLIEIRPKIGTYVSLIDAELVEEVRHLRAVLEAEIARMACEKLTPADIDRLWLCGGCTSSVRRKRRSLHWTRSSTGCSMCSAAARTGTIWWKILPRILTAPPSSASAAARQRQSMRITSACSRPSSRRIQTLHTALPDSTCSVIPRTFPPSASRSHSISKTEFLQMPYHRQKIRHIFVYFFVERLLTTPLKRYIFDSMKYIT